MEAGIVATLINAAAVVVGGTIGLLFRNRIPKIIGENITKAIGLCVCVIGISGVTQGGELTVDPMLVVVSLALGSLVGELARIEDGLNLLGRWIQNKLSRHDGNSTFAEGFVAATLLFCVGAMSIVGSIESGLNNDRSIILTKSILDGVSSMILASTLGIGVLFSAIVILVYQGSIEFFAGCLQTVLTKDLITQISAVGSVMILGIGLNMTLNAKIKVANLLPGLVVAVVYYYVLIH